MATSRVEILGIRHHGPGSARSVLAALAELQPDLLLIEGAPELDALIAGAADPALVPPVAGLVYAVDDPRRAAFYPMAEFSPEWVALRWALAHEVPVHFADLPATHLLAEPEHVSASDDTTDTTDTGKEDHQPAAGKSADEESVDEESAAEEPDRTAPTVPDLISLLAHAAGQPDPERWWEDAVEHRHDTALADFHALLEAVTLARPASAGHDDPLTLRREAAMRKVLRAAIKDQHERIAFVCGAFHAPALVPDSFPSAAADNRLLTRLPRAKVTATWAPWTADRLSLSSGYGAGVSSPGWYAHLFRTWALDPTAVTPSWLVRVARTLRAEQLEVPPAGVVEATRLADALAALRRRTAAGLEEMHDAVQATLCDGSRLPLQIIDDDLVIGHELGQVPPDTPMVPLAADLARTQRSLRLKPAAKETTVHLDLRTDSGRARSALFHRLALLDIGWASPADVGSTRGTFREAWRLEWVPDLAVSVIEASRYGTTVTAAAGNRVRRRIGEAELPELTALLDKSLVADLSEVLPELITAVADAGARQRQIDSLMQALGPLARTLRYGDVRGAGVAGLDTVVRTVVTRICVGLRPACHALDDAAAEQMRAAIDDVDAAINLLDQPELTGPWRGALAALGDDSTVHGSVSGRVTRILLDCGDLSAQDAGLRLSRRLSSAGPAPEAAAWLDGFLAGEALLLIHEREILALIDRWLDAVPDTVFEDLLPLLRRTFTRFAGPERRMIGAAVGRLGSGDATLERPQEQIDEQWAAPAVRRVGQLLGLGGSL